MLRRFETERATSSPCKN